MAALRTTLHGNAEYGVVRAARRARVERGAAGTLAAQSRGRVHPVTGRASKLAPVIAVLGLWHWRDRPDVTWLVVGAVQALFGLYVYLERFHVA